MMAKYINADALREIWVWGKNDKYGYSECIPLKDLDDFPAADARENVHGEWLYQELIPNDITGTMHGECSVCHKVRIIDKFCPNCGADMRGVDHESDI